ncbi:MAG: nucleotidyltransferase family protein [Caulobacteraceae bacterium]|nr:nucleotidyltransferase family protein [Caulobacteraceae bacterium]
MVLAAGLGTRMRPLTDTRPKALVEVAGKALIDHTLDRLEAVGVERAVVNVHAFADQMEAHLARRTSPQILISDERGGLLETGGGIKRARTLLGEGPIWVANSDYVWLDQADGGLAEVARRWDADAMDACIVVIPKARTLGFDTPGDFFGDPEGALTPRGAAGEAPLHAFGLQILNPQPVYATAAEAFSLRNVWFDAAARRRLIGVQPAGLWMQVGDPAALDLAEARLAGRAPPS